MSVLKARKNGAVAAGAGAGLDPTEEGKCAGTEHEAVRGTALRSSLKIHSLYGPAGQGSKRYKGETDVAMLDYSCAKGTIDGWGART